jgi:hypothetical protein
MKRLCVDELNGFHWSNTNIEYGVTTYNAKNLMPKNAG